MTTVTKGKLAEKVGLVQVQSFAQRLDPLEVSVLDRRTVPWSSYPFSSSSATRYEPSCLAGD